MKQVLAAFVLLLVMMGIVAWTSQPETLKNLGIGGEVPEEQKEEEKVKITIGDATFQVVVADSAPERARGLSGRESLAQGEGMLFVFEDGNVRPSFWMKEMNFAIDIIWIDDGKVVQIDQNLPPTKPETPDAEIPLYLPKQPIDQVVELAAGEVKNKKIKVGDRVVLEQ